MPTTKNTTKGAGVVLTPEVRDLMDAVLEVMGRPFREPKDAGRCCDACETLRRAEFCCAACGFSGQPIVWACQCPKDAAEYLKMWRGLLERVEAGEVIQYEDGTDKGTYTVEMLRQIVEMDGPRADPTYRCDDAGCCHGARECPVCHAVAGAEESENDVARHLAGILRDIRILLRIGAHA